MQSTNKCTQKIPEQCKIANICPKFLIFGHPKKNIKKIMMVKIIIKIKIRIIIRIMLMVIMVIMRE